MTLNETEIKDFLIKLSEEIDPSGFNHFAFKSRSKKWHFGYTDVFRKPSKVNKFVLPQRAVITIMRTSTLIQVEKPSNAL